MYVRNVCCLVLVFAAWTGECVKYSSKYKHVDLVVESDKNETKQETIEKYWPVRIFNCVGDIGVEKCLKVFLLARMDYVAEAMEKRDSNVTIDFDVIDEIKKNFKWEEYKRIGEKELNAEIFKKSKNIFRNKKTKLVLNPGIAIDVFPDQNGTIMLSIKKDPELQLPRGMKVPKKMFYRLIPILLIPPLIMSAILPFVLPAMKILILWVALLNQAALMGAVFTLMRNNAFHESAHEKRIIYVNDGYKNEKRPPPIIHHQEDFHGPPNKNIHLHDEFNPNPPINHFKGSFSHTHEEIEESDDDEGPVGPFHRRRPNFEDDEFDRKSPYFRSDINFGMKRRRKYNG